MIMNKSVKRSSKKRAFSIFGVGATMLYSSAAVAGTVSLVYTALQMPDSLVANWLVRPLAAIGVVTVSGSATIPVTKNSTSVTSPTPAPSTGIPQTKISVNVVYPTYFSNSRAFMNLAAGSNWTLISPVTGWGNMPADHLNADQTFRLSAGEGAARSLSQPTAVLMRKSVDVVCRWQGSGTVRIIMDSITKNISYSSQSLRFTWVPDRGQTVTVVISDDMNNANPVRGLDCREADASRTQIFDPVFLANVKKYNLLRFMDWQATNGNAQQIRWSTRTTPDTPIYCGKDGVALEYMIELANQTKTNPWFTIPWNADDDYIRRFAQMVRDRLDPSLTVYVELSNEVWNYMFPVTGQAWQEAVNENLSGDRHQGMLFRYSEKSGQVLDIWKDVFNGQSSRLVRVLATQNQDWAAEQVLNFRDTASKIDAIATAPYFHWNADEAGRAIDPNNFDALFANLKGAADANLNTAKQIKARAAAKGKRYIAYEAGQHLTGGSNLDVVKAVQRDKRMGQLYKYYLTRWQQEIGDQIALYNDVGGIALTGGWGLQEYLGQPLTEAPKAQAVNLYIASINNK
jgi:hypothetical protein